METVNYNLAIEINCLLFDSLPSVHQPLRMRLQEMETSVQNNDNRIEPMDWEEVEINYDSVEPMDWEDIEKNDISLNMNDSVEPMDWESVDTVYPPCLSFDYQINAS